MLAERMEGWFEEATRKGMQQGMRQGEVLLLRRLLARRFGPLPDSALARLSGASLEQLETWGERVLDAGSLEEVFGGAGH